MLPEKPTHSAWGYLSGGRPLGCTLPELRKVVLKDQVPPVRFVWTPEHPRLVPPGETAEFRHDILRRYRGRCYVTIGSGLPWAAMIGLHGMIGTAPISQSHLWIMVSLLGVLPILAGAVTLLRSWVWADAVLAEDTETERYWHWVGQRSRSWTWFLLGGIVIVTVVQLFVGLEESIDAAGLVKPDIRAGEWWRLFTAPLMHAGLLHLFMNGAALFAVGRMVEAIVRPAAMPLVFLISAFVGSLFSLMLIPQTPSVGASGGILGLIGCAVVIGWRRRLAPWAMVRSLVIGIILIAVLGAAAHEMIDNAAHGGGLLAGLLLGVWFSRRGDATPIRLTWWEHVAGWAAGVMLLAALMWTLGKLTL